MADLEHNKRVVRRFMDEVSDGGDIDLLDELCTPHVINHAARPGLQNGLEAFKALMRGIHQSQGERRWTEQRYVAENDLVVVYGIREGCWRAPSFRGVTTPEGKIATELAHLFRLHDGLIAEHWAVRDDLGMMQQLGVLPKPDRVP
jgi:predicted SnoaL-like aldol condensation-catalyzing enzyme